MEFRKFLKLTFSDTSGFTMLELAISSLFIAGLALSTASLVQQTNEFSNQIAESNSLEAEVNKFNRAIRLPKNCALNFHNLKLYGSPGEAYISSIHYKVTGVNGSTVLDSDGSPLIKTLFQSAHPLDQAVVQATNTYIQQLKTNFVPPPSTTTTTETTTTTTADPVGNGYNTNGNPDAGDNGDGTNSTEETSEGDLPETPTFDGNEFEIFTEDDTDTVTAKQVLIDGDPNSAGGYSLDSRENISQTQLQGIRDQGVGPSKPFSKHYFIQSIKVVKIGDSQSNETTENPYFNQIYRSAFKVVVSFKTAAPAEGKTRLKELVRVYKFEAFFQPSTNRIICGHKQSQDVIDRAIRNGCEEMSGNFDALTGRCLLPSYQVRDCDTAQNKYVTGFDKDNVTNSYNIKCQNITDIADELNDDYAVNINSGSTCPAGEIPFSIVSGFNELGWPKVECQPISYIEEYEELFSSALITGCGNYVNVGWSFIDLNFIAPECN